jgi:uncharacterized membrane protein
VTQLKLNQKIMAFIILSIIGTILIYPSLPGRIPQHWNIDGQADGFGGKGYLFITAVLPLGIYLMMVFLPKLDPKKDSYLNHAKAYQVTHWALTLFLICLHWITIGVASGYPLNVGIFIRILLGILFIILGNYLTQVRPNYFFGIKTPWTLANEEVWRKTHRVGGYGFVIAGLLDLVSAFFKGSAAFILTIGSICAVTVFAVIYSYLEYRKLELPK